MGLKKYEIITVGSDKRVRALRSWQVGDRYVNIGDVGGIVYDEKTLSQEGACWLFKGNFGFPGARIGGDSIVDVAETTLSTTGAPAVDILGSSVLVGNKLLFVSDQTAAGAVTLGETLFEQGTFNFAAGANWETWKAGSANQVRTKNPIFAGGKATTLKLDVPGYTVQAFVLDRDGNGMTATAPTNTGVGVTLAIPAGQYFVLRLTKAPVSAIIPADATTAAITFTGTYETKLSIIDSRVEINPATSTGTTTIRPGGTYTIASGAKYPEAVIRNSKVSMMVHATANRSFRLMGQIIGSTATLDATAGDVSVAGQYSNIKNLMASGTITSNLGVTSYNVIQATNCNDFAVSSTIFPGRADATSANMPFIFQGCNVPDGRFYHHAQIANTYKNIDFAKASVDLGKTLVGNREFASSEVEGLYRLVTPASGLVGCLVESFASVEKLTFYNFATAYNTTIYKDAYLNGLFAIAGNNVFGNKVRSHPLAQVLNVQPRAVQGMFNTVTPGAPITGVVANANRVCVPVPFRVNGSKGLTINCPAGVEGAIICTDINGVIKGLTVLATGESSVPAAQLVNTNAYLFFGKAGATAITPADLAGVTVTVYNGCKIVNTGANEVNMKGNIRVEDNATLVNANITGTGYFGGNAVTSGITVNGYAYMKDNALCTKNFENVQTFASLVMEGNAVYINNTALDLDNLKVFMYDNSKMLGGIRSSVTLIMRDNAALFEGRILEGSVTFKDNAIVSSGYIRALGDITLCGSYNQTVDKTWTGKRVIDNQDAPEYDNNVKTQYDF